MTQTKTITNDDLIKMARADVAMYAAKRQRLLAELAETDKWLDFWQGELVNLAGEA